MTLSLSARRARHGVVLAGLALLVIVWPSPAFAHARPTGTDPADGQVVMTSPDAITVTFDEPVSLPAAGNQLLDAAGDPVDADVTVRDSVLSFAPSSALARGTYVVAWRVVSADTHPVAGGFTFSVGAPSATTVVVPAAEEQREVNVVRVGAEFARYAGLLAMAGIIGFVALLAPSAAVRRAGVGGRLRRAAGISGVVGATGQLVLLPISALWESGQSLSTVFAGSTWSTALDSPTAVATVLVTAGVAVALVAAGRERFVLSVAGAALAVGSLAVVGHTRSFGPAWLVLGADLAHVAAAAIWWGGLIALTICLLARPALKPGVRAEAIARFSTVAAYAVAVLVLAGVALYWRIGHSWSGLWDSDYGRLVLLKSALMMPVVAVAAWNRTRLVPSVARRPGGDAERLLTRLVRVEAGILLVVLAATSLLVTQTPPARDVPAESPIATRTLELDVAEGVRATVVVTPVRRGVNAIQVAVTDENDEPVEVLGTPELSVTLKANDIGPLVRPLSASGASAWEATSDFPLPGEWTITLAVRLSEFVNPVVSGTVDIP